jgi:hypothetical protein
MGEEGQQKPQKAAQLTRVWRVFGSGCLIAILLLCFAWTYAHRNDPRIVNYLVNCFPVPLTILIAFMPDLRKAHVVWRILIVLFGVAWSFLLWRQMDLSAKQATDDQKRIVGDAVTQANTHSDQQFGKTQKQIDGVEDSVSETQKDIDSKFDQENSTFSTDLSKVGKPDPPEQPQLKFSLWTDSLKPEEFPLKSLNIQPGSDGNLEISFAVMNDSSVEADNVEIWVLICDVCSFSKEPVGFDRPPGLNEHIRHRIITSIGAGVTIRENNTIDVKVNQLGATRTSVIFKSTCKTCGRVKQSDEFWIDIEPNLMQPQ